MMHLPQCSIADFHLPLHRREQPPAVEMFFRKRKQNIELAREDRRAALHLFFIRHPLVNVVASSHRRQYQGLFECLRRTFGIRHFLPDEAAQPLLPTLEECKSFLLRNPHFSSPDLHLVTSLSPCSPWLFRYSQPLGQRAKPRITCCRNDAKTNPDNTPTD